MYLDRFTRNMAKQTQLLEPKKCVCVSGYIEGLRRQIYHRTPKAKMVYVSGYIEGPGGKYTTGHLEPIWAVLKASGARQLYIFGISKR